MAFVPHLGVQNDEALFAAPLFRPYGWHYKIRVFHSELPLLLINYLGTLKTLIYKPIFRWFGVSAATIRWPMLLAGAATVWLFYLLLRRVAGERAGLIGCTLLAADSLFLLTTCFDWGPVALQHLLITGGMLSAVIFYQEGRTWLLGLAFFLFGLAVWDKALAVWMISGIAIAAFCTAPRQILGRLTPGRAAVAVFCFVLGALPLLLYNWNSRFDTFRDNSTRDFHGLAPRAGFLRNTIEGRSLFGWMFEEDWHSPVPRAPVTELARASDGISTLAGHPRGSLMFYGLVLAVLLAPLARGRDLRAILFAVIAGAVAWIQMATTANAGGSAHHTILLWPLPAMAIAVSLAAASRRLPQRAGIAAAAAVTLALAGSEVLVTNEYYRLAVRNGGTVYWTDAVYTLSEYMKSSTATSVSCVDWGMMDTLRLLNRGKLPLRWGGDESDADLRELLEKPGSIFLGHPAAREIFAGSTEKFVKRAETLGYERRMIAVIGDSFGRPTFEVFRFARQEDRRLKEEDRRPDERAF